MQSLAAPSPLSGAWPRAMHARRVLWIALALSMVVHVAFTMWPFSLGPAPDPEDIPLTATITEMPPPPLPVAKAPPAPPKRKTRPSPVPAPENSAAAEAALPSPEASTAAPESPEAPPVARSAAAPLAERVEGPSALPPNGRVLPPRVDLAYKLYLGSHGFLIGDATYRFEHADNRYRIYTVGKAQGLAALLIRGEGRMESRGLITADGLQPYEFTFERSDTGKREVTKFDWESGIVTLNEQKTESIDTPMFDALSLMWQYYFTPPDDRQIAFTLATTRRVTRYTVTHEGSESIAWGNGTIATERWHRVSDDGKNDSYAWLAPSLRYLPVKMRLSNTRGSVDVVLDAIRVDPATKAGDDAWAPNIAGGTAMFAPPKSPPGVAPGPMEFAPGATFPTNTGS